MSNKIIIYQNKERETRLEVKLEDETLWLPQSQIVDLLDSSKANIKEHIKHIFQSGELIESSTVRKFRTVRREVSREISHYALDVIISVGYRVNSARGAPFHIWANKVLKDYLLKGYSLNNPRNRVEDNTQSLREKVNQIDLRVKTSLPPKQGISYKQLTLDPQKHQQRYHGIIVRPHPPSHDRFIIVDHKTVYHFGASLKDLGKKWFVCSQMGIQL